MSTEPPENWDNVSHGSLQPNPMYRDVSLTQFVGRYCKLAFPAGDNRLEYMWVEVTKVHAGRLIGTLDNDPVLAMEYQCGDQVEFGRDEIIDVEGEE